MEPLKYFVFNKKRDYLHGYTEQIRITDDGLELYVEPPRQDGTFFSRLLDSGQEGNDWHRAVIQSVDYGDDSIRFFFYCSDSSQILLNGRLLEWWEVIESRELTAKEKHEAMRPFLAHQVLNPKDILLYHAKGRYLWMEIQLFCQAEKTPKILNMKLYAENRSFLRYLPEIYRTQPENDFLKRFLSLFEAVYQDMDEKIRTSARQMDPATAESEFLKWMAEWAGISEAHLWPEDKLRVLLKGIVGKNLIRGTRAYMSNIIETFTGETPFFVEYGEIEAYKGNRKVYRKLLEHYAHDPYIVNILVREQAVPARQEQKALKRIIEDMKPAHMEVRLIILKPYIYLNKNVYVGVNSVLGTYQKARLDGMTAIPSVVGVLGVSSKQMMRSGEKKEEADIHEESEKFSV
ncbi:MAG: hypothetical protein HFG80_01645 [Eubacterium sp.]|nr:hypothetical protein [Eubacterium sp.]